MSAHEGLNAQLLDQLDFWWSAHFRPRVEGMSDAEYFWEPAPDGWSLRPGGDGRLLLDGGWTIGEVAPFTNIAWRMCHLGSVFWRRASAHFGDGSFDEATTMWPAGATEAIGYIESGFQQWREGVAAMGD